MLSAILFIGAISLLFYGLLQTQRMTAEFAQRNIHHFEAKVMKEIFLHDYLAIPPQERPKEMTMVFNIGTLRFENKDRFKIQVMIEGKTLTFQVSTFELAQLDDFEETTVTTETSSETETHSTTAVAVEPTPNSQRLTEGS